MVSHLLESLLILGGGYFAWKYDGSYLLQPSVETISFCYLFVLNGIILPTLQCKKVFIDNSLLLCPSSEKMMKIMSSIECNIISLDCS